MKKEILKIAGVKSEKEFYKKYPTEEAFMKAHGKEFKKESRKKSLKKAAMGTSMVEKQLTQLTDFANPPQAQDGGYVPQPQIGDYIGGEQDQFEPIAFQDYYDQLDYANTGMTDQLRWEQQQAYANQQSGQGDSAAMNIGNIGDVLSESIGGMKRGGKIPKAQNSLLGGIPSNLGYKPMGLPKAPQAPAYLGAGADGNTSTTQTGGGALGQIAGVLGPAGQIFNAGKQVFDAIKQQKQAKQNKMLANLSLEASSTRPEIQQRRYVTPDMMAYGTKQPGQTTGMGVGNPFLAAYGATIGGNPTEIQNMYTNDDTLYSDLGYEPLSDSDVVKQYRRGGNIPKAITGQVIGAIAGALGNIGSSVINIGTENLQKQANQALGKAAFQQGIQATQDQYSGFMEDGGEVGLKYLSHTWQPQVITKFGDYNVKDLLKADPTMNTLRAGGHIAQVGYTAPSERAMSTERPMSFALGGELQTHWGGEADVVSYNPYLEDGSGSGESIEFKGKYHSQSAGNGKTGIGITFGESPVEVENGEPGQKMSNGGSANDESFIVFGAKDWSNVFDPELNFANVSGKKIKSRVNSLNDMEKRQNKIMEKSNDELAKLDPSDPYDLLKFNSFTKKLEGADQKLKLIAEDKKTYAAFQEGVLDLWKENKFHPDLQLDDVLKGKIKYGKDPNMAKSGAKLKKAQAGKTLYELSKSIPSDYDEVIEEQEETPYVSPLDSRWDKYLPQKAPNITIPYAPGQEEPELMLTKQIVDDTSSKSKKGGGLDWMDVYNMAYQTFRPGIRNPLSPEQTAAEMMALGTNTPTAVQAQSYMPILEDVPPMVVFQDQLNEIQAEANASKRLVGNNPAALAMIDAQAYAAKNKVLAEQFRINQGLKMESMRRNIATLNDATLKNLAIYDQQYIRQSEANSKTKAIAQTALASIADKVGKNKAETLSANVMANMYPQYRFGPDGRIYNVGFTKFNTAKVGDLTIDQLKEALKEDKKTAKNGSIVKAIKNL